MLVGHPGASWRGWLKAHRGSADLLCLDPADPAQPRPAQLTLFQDSLPFAWRFYGSVGGFHAPHALLAAATLLAERSQGDLVIQAPAYRPSPVARHTLLLLAEILRPDAILIAGGTSIEPNGFAVGPEAVEAEEGFPPMVQAAQRKARWMGFLESARLQEIRLDRVAIEGARLGSGIPLTADALAKHLPTAVYAELAGSTLFVVAGEPLGDDQVARGLDAFHANRIHVASPHDYVDLACGLARGTGEDFALGVIRAIDFRARTLQIQSDAIPPAPATILRLGSLLVDASGNERGEIKPWSV